MNADKGIRVYTKETLLTISDTKSNAIVQDILFDSDMVLLIAKDKVGKSLLALQLAASISSGTKFLNTFEISSPQRVWYFATEGKDDDLRERLIRMNKKVLVNPTLFTLFCSNRFKFNMPESESVIRRLIQRYRNELPRVVFIDALYKGVIGSIKNDDVVTGFFDMMEIFREECHATIVIVHHSKRPIRYEGQIIDEGDDSIFGSYVLRAAPDHILFMGDIPREPKHKFLRCETQRSGNIAESMELKLNEPDPLYFEIVEPEDNGTDRVMALITASKNGISVNELMRKVGISRTMVYTAINYLGNRLDKVGNRPVLYKLKG